MLCEHLDRLDRAIKTSGIRETSRGKAWSERCREWVYYECLLDLAEIRRRFDLDGCVVEHENFSTHEGQEEGFYCEVHFDGVMGFHRKSALGTPPLKFPPEVGPESFTPSDRSLLLSLLVASGGGPAPVAEVLSTFNRLNLPLLKYCEFAYGLRRLNDRGIIEGAGGGLSVTADFTGDHAKNIFNCSALDAQLEAAERALAEWGSSKQELGSEISVTEEEYDKAIMECFKGFLRIGPKR